MQKENTSKNVSKTETIPVCKNLMALINKFGLTLSPKQIEIYEEAFFHDSDTMEDYIYALESGLPMTGRVAELALFIDGLDKRYNKI